MIDNDLPSGTDGAIDAFVGSGGELSSFRVTGIDIGGGGLISEQVIFEYQTFIDVGNDGDAFLLSGSPATPSGDDAVTSSGSFFGEAGNTIRWSVTTSIPDFGSVLSSVFTFEAETGTVGEMRVIQYLDEDVFGVSDDFLFTRGTAATEDLELFTVDSATGLGVSQSGGFGTETGLEAAEFAGWVADAFPDLDGPPGITDNLEYTIGGNVDTDDLPPSSQPGIGPGFGPADVTTALAWDLDPTATAATVVTTLGGVSFIPEPSAAISLLVLVGGVAGRRGRGLRR